MAQEYISQVSEEIEGRVTEKLSKEFSRTESRIMGALSNLVEFLLNPQVRTYSVAIPGTTRNGDPGNREPNGDPSPNDPSPEVGISSYHSGNLNSSEVESILTKPSKIYQMFFLFTWPSLRELLECFYRVSRVGTPLGCLIRSVLRTYSDDQRNAFPFLFPPSTVIVTDTFVTFKSETDLKQFSRDNSPHRTIQMVTVNNIL